MTMKDLRYLLSDLLFAFENKYGLFHETTKQIRTAYLFICQEMERNGENL